MSVLDPYSTRYLCDILKDIRAAYKTRNFSYLPGLIEELQYRAYRMENRLEQIADIKALETERINIKKEIETLKQERRGLKIEMNKEISTWEE